MAAALLGAACAREAAPESPPPEGEAADELKGFCPCAAPPQAPSVVAGPTAWVRVSDLAPAWGSFTSDLPSEGQAPYDKWVTAGDVPVRLTWVADFTDAGNYAFWFRQAHNYGNVQMFVDDVPVTLDPTLRGAKFWTRFGFRALTPGVHHIDLVLQSVSIDGLLVSRAPDFDPNITVVPDHVPHLASPATRVPRDYRFAGRTEPFTMGFPRAWDDDVGDYHPAHADGAPAPTLELWGAPGQFVTGAFAFHVNHATPRAYTDVTLAGLGSIGVPDIDVRIGLPRRIDDWLWHATHRPATELLVKDDTACGSVGGACLFEDKPLVLGDHSPFGGGWARTGAPAGEDRLAWITVRVPETASGTMLGTISVHDPGDSSRQLSVPVRLVVVPVDLQPVTGAYGAFHPGCEGNPGVCTVWRSASQLARDMEDMADHGFNTMTLYDGYEMTELALAAGFSDSLVWMDDAPTAPLGPDKIGKANALGVTRLSHWTADELALPPAQIAAMADAYHAGGHSATATLNTRCYQDPTGAAPGGGPCPPGYVDVLGTLAPHVDRPMLALTAFHQRTDPLAFRRTYTDATGAEVLKGMPLAYYAFGPTIPMWHRLMFGGYPRALGYDGMFVWSYFDGLTHTSMVGMDSWGHGVPTRHWEAVRAGIDDMRYVQALKRKLHEAQARVDSPGDHAPLAAALAAATTVYDQRYRCMHDVDCVNDPWIGWYIQRLPTEAANETPGPTEPLACGSTSTPPTPFGFDRARCEIARATLALQTAILAD